MGLNKMVLWDGEGRLLHGVELDVHIRYIGLGN